MSVILYDAKDLGALAFNVSANHELREAFPSVEDRLNEALFKHTYDQETNRINCFFDRLYMANQLAYYYTYQDECSKDGSFSLQRLQDKDCKPFANFRGQPLSTDKAIWEALTSLRYNIIANSGKSFFSADDCERLDNLINRLGYNIISRAK